MWTANLFLYRDMSVYLQEPHSKRRAGQSFSNCGLKITYIVWEWTSSLSGSVNRQINREWQLFLLRNMQQKKGWKRIEMIIKMVNEFKLTVVHFARPNPPLYPASLFPLTSGWETASCQASMCSKGWRLEVRDWPKPDGDLCMRVYLLLYKKTVKNQDWVTGQPGCWASGPRAIAGHGPRATGPRACF